MSTSRRTDVVPVFHNAMPDDKEFLLNLGNPCRMAEASQYADFVKWRNRAEEDTGTPWRMARLCNPTLVCGSSTLLQPCSPITRVRKVLDRAHDDRKMHLFHDTVRGLKKRLPMGGSHAADISRAEAVALIQRVHNVHIRTALWSLVNIGARIADQEKVSIENMAWMDRNRIRGVHFPED